MGVAAHREPRTKSSGAACPIPVQVEPVGIGVQLERAANLRGQLDNRLHIDCVALALADLAPVRVIERIDQRIRDRPLDTRGQDRKSTRLNSSHVRISYAVFCLKKKKKR